MRSGDLQARRLSLGMAREGLGVAEVADRMGLDAVGFLARMYRREEFTMEEIRTLSGILALDADEIKWIFFEC